MSMKSKELIKSEMKTKLLKALQSENEEELAEAFAELGADIEQSVKNDYAMYKEENEERLIQLMDSKVLESRGVRQITSEERKYYEKFIEASKSGNPKQALTDFTVALPFTIIDSVLEDIRQNHPLLSAINFTNVQAITKWILNDKDIAKATWGKLTSAISTEIEGAIKEIDITACKLTAFMYLSEDMVDMGPLWVDNFVRSYLYEALSLGLEDGVVNGNGKDCPVGMTKDPNGNFNATTGYPDKTGTQAIALTALDAEALGPVLAKLCQGPHKIQRNITELLLVVNPIDYFTKIFPAYVIMNTAGAYVTNLPFPTNIVTSVAVTSGKAVVGIATDYFMGVGAGTNGGRIEFSDDFKFLDDMRTYKIKMYGNGRAKYSESFLLADISGMETGGVPVKVKGTVNTKTVTP